jgi:hypothetical protein
MKSVLPPERRRAGSSSDSPAAVTHEVQSEVRPPHRPGACRLPDLGGARETRIHAPGPAYQPARVSELMLPARGTVARLLVPRDPSAVSASDSSSVDGRVLRWVRSSRRRKSSMLEGLTSDCWTQVYCSLSNSFLVLVDARGGSRWGLVEHDRRIVRGAGYDAHKLIVATSPRWQQVRASPPPIRRRHMAFALTPIDRPLSGSPMPVRTCERSRQATRRAAAPGTVASLPRRRCPGPRPASRRSRSKGRH